MVDLLNIYQKALYFLFYAEIHYYYTHYLFIELIY